MTPPVPDARLADASSPRPATVAGWLLLGLVLMAATAIWLRNRDILSDTYDYSSMIVSAGKLEAGLKPYVDFRSTMQTGSYLFNRGAECVFGRSYLGLTWGGLTLTLGGALVLFALWRRALGDVVAALLAGAVTLAGLSQHVVIFYNPVGLLCLAVVVAVMPELGERGRITGWRLAAVVAALLVGGINKINFHALALGLAGLFVLHAAVSGRITWRRLVTWWIGLVVVGAVVPLVFELVWTGASWSQWCFNVISLAAERVGFVGLVFSAHTYSGPTYDLHPHILVKPLHTIGLAITVAMLIGAWRVRPRGAARVSLGLLAVAAGLGGVLLTVTNVESIALTSQGTLLAAVAVVVAGGLAGRRSARIGLGAGAALWIAVGGYAAWTGSRVLYARSQADRATFVRLVDAPASIRYLEGVRLDAGLHDSLLLLDKDLAKIVQADGDASHVLFGPALEWLERAHPESIMEGMPVWYHVGTALREDDGPWLIKHFEARHITDFFTHPGWEGWPPDFQAYLDQHYRRQPLGMLRHYEWRDAEPKPIAGPAVFAAESALALLERTGSNVHLGMTRIAGGHAPAFTPSPWGDFYGASDSWTWRWEAGVRDVEGVLVAVADASAGDFAPVKLRWRIIADPDGVKQPLWDSTVTLAPGQTELRAPFRIQASGNTIALMIEVAGDDASRITAGWRDVRINQAGDAAQVQPPAPLGAALHDTAIAGPRDVAGRATWVRTGEASASEGWIAGPTEMWTGGAAAGGDWQATLEIEPRPTEGGVVPILMLVWSKGPRLEMLQQLGPPVEQGNFTVKAWMPEPGGWIGVAVRPLDAGRPFNARLRLLRWSP